MNRILILDKEHLLGAGVESLLSQEENITIMGLATDFSIDQNQYLKQEIEQFRPDVVILNNDLLKVYFNLLVGLINLYPEMKFIVVNPLDNRLHVYEKREITIACSDDLVSIIR